MRAGDPRWSRVNDLFHAAVAVSPAERDAFLSIQCGADAALRAEVESLLAMHRDRDDGAAFGACVSLRTMASSSSSS